MTEFEAEGDGYLGRILTIFFAYYSLKEEVFSVSLLFGYVQ